mmetsp:Transcript_40834/g.46830  ORF Transcript_40834/g.46830 Transcript_40834/m.46830 type:complete len:219 (-) Transcript_40834:2045-2701(-)
MPTPMLASMIIGTSLAPSPMDSRMQPFLYLLARPTTTLFCFGVTLQHTTDFEYSPSVRNSCSSSSSPRINASVMPSMTIVIGYCSTRSLRGFLNTSVGVCASSFLAKCVSISCSSRCLIFFLLSSSITCRFLLASSSGRSLRCSVFLGLMDRMISFMSSWINLHDLAISMAVSCLSPVRTQTLMLAFMRLAMVSGTSSWSKSSMADAPTNSRSLSYLS